MSIGECIVGINHGRIVNWHKIYAAMFIIFAAITIEMSWKYSLEIDKRQQAVFNLEHVVGCFFDYETTTGNPLSKGALKHCVGNMRTTPTGDGYALDRLTKEFLYDGSTDVPPGTKYFTKDSIGKSFKEWGTAEVAIPYLFSGTSSSQNVPVSYNYDGSTEWLEYKPYTTLDGRELVAVQGVQKDEVMDAHWIPIAMARTAVFVYVMWLISTAIGGRRYDDKPRCNTSSNDTKKSGNR